MRAFTLSAIFFLAGCAAGPQAIRDQAVSNAKATMTEAKNAKKAIAEKASISKVESHVNSARSYCAALMDKANDAPTLPLWVQEQVKSSREECMQDLAMVLFSAGNYYVLNGDKALAERSFKEASANAQKIGIFPLSQKADSALKELK